MVDSLRKVVGVMGGTSDDDGSGVFVVHYFLSSRAQDTRALMMVTRVEREAGGVTDEYMEVSEVRGEVRDDSEKFNTVFNSKVVGI